MDNAWGKRADAAFSSAPRGADAVRLLYATPFLPHEGADHGGGAYLAALLGALAARADVALVSFATDAELRARTAPAGRLASVDLVARTLRGEGSRPRHALRMLARFVAGTPIAAAKFTSRTMAAALHDAALRFSPDVVLLEMSVMAQFVHAVAGSPTIVTDHEAGGAIPASLGFGLGQRHDRHLWRGYVDHHYRAASSVQALNDDDASTLSARLGRPVAVRPPTVAMPALAAEPASAGARMLFVGDYAHHPNPVAAAWLVRELLPAVRARVPHAELWLAGPRATDEVRALAAAAGVRVLGFVPDLAALYRDVRCLVAPLFSGSGSRIKVLTALAHGVGVVSNALGLRGIAAPPPAVQRGESTAALCDAVVPLLVDAESARRAGAAARAWALAHVSPDAVARRQLELCEALLADRPR